MGYRGVFIRALLLSLLLLTVPLGLGMAGGPKPGCAGNLCGRGAKTFHPDPIGSHLPGAVCPIGYAFCANLAELEQERTQEVLSKPFIDFMEWAFGPIRDVPYVIYRGMGDLTPEEEFVADLTGGLAVELPKMALDLIGDATPNLPPIVGRLGSGGLGMRPRTPYTPRAPGPPAGAVRASESFPRGSGLSATLHGSRREALRAAKRANAIPMGAQPLRTIRAGTPEGFVAGLDNRNIVLYEYKNIFGKKIHIRQDKAFGYGQAGIGDQGPHFNAGEAGGRLSQHFYFESFP